MVRESNSTDPLSKKPQLALTQNMRSWHHLFIVRFLDTGLPLPIIYTLKGLLDARSGLHDPRARLAE